MSQGNIVSDRKEKQKADGFLKKWFKGSRQVSGQVSGKGQGQIPVCAVLRTWRTYIAYF